ncbi:MAG: hypothetical protein ACJAXH_002085, partial [Colwellia sp.]
YIVNEMILVEKSIDTSSDNSLTQFVRIVYQW